MAWVWSTLIRSVIGGVIGNNDATIELEGVIPNRQKARIDTISLLAVGEMKPLMYKLDVKLKSGEHIHMWHTHYPTLKQKFPHPRDADKIFEAEFKWSNTEYKTS